MFRSYMFKTEYVNQENLKRRTIKPKKNNETSHGSTIFSIESQSVRASLKLPKNRRDIDISSTLKIESQNKDKPKRRSLPNENLFNFGQVKSYANKNGQSEKIPQEERNLIQQFQKIQLQDPNVTPISYPKNRRTQTQITPNLLDYFHQKAFTVSPKKARTTCGSDAGRSAFTDEFQVDSLKKRINFMYLQEIQMKKAMEAQKKRLSEKESLIKKMKKEYDDQVKRLEAQRDEEILKRFEYQKQQLAIYQQEEQSRQNQINLLKNQNKQLRVDNKKLQSAIMILKINNLSQENKLDLPLARGWKNEAVQNSMENYQTNPSSDPNQSPQPAHKTFDSYIFDTPADLAKYKMQAQEQLARLDPAYRIESQSESSVNEESQASEEDFGISQEHKLKKQKLGLL